MQHPLAMVETAESVGVRRAELLEGTGITDEMLLSSEARISYAQFGRLTNNAVRLTGLPHFGAVLGRRIHTGNLGMLGLAVMTSENIGAALRVALQYYRSLAPAWDLSLEVKGDTATLRFQETISHGYHSVLASETMLVAFASQAEFLLGRPVPMKRVRFGYPVPAHAGACPELYAMEGGTPVSFNHGTTEVEFDAALLREPVRWSDPITAQEAERQCAAAQTVSATRADGLVARVRRELAMAREEYPTESSVARALCTSPRTLRRGLQQMRTSFQALLDEDRRERAFGLLRSTTATSEHIAIELGFSDVRSFRRAFKRWTGKPPSVYRAELGIHVEGDRESVAPSGVYASDEALPLDVTQEAS
jgi:AraC-like DNA-binding protein